MDYRQTVSSGPGTERHEAGRLLVCAVTVAATWIVLGARPGDSLMSVDGVNNLLPLYATLFHTGGDWHALTYRLEDFGGANLLGTYGLLPVSILMAKLGISPLWNLNLSLMFIQVCIAWLAIASVRAIAGRPGTAPVSAYDAFLTGCLVWLLAFSPMLAWRVQAGHLTYIAGLGVVQAMLCLWVCHLTGARSIVTQCVAFITLVNGLCMQGFQMIVYALTFALPLLFATWATLVQPVSKRALHALAYCLVAGLAGVLMAMPVLSQMLAYSLGPDAPRSPGKDVVTYGYIVSTWRDWLSALNWFDLNLARRPAAVLHEVDYGMGPMLALAIPLLSARLWKPVAGLVLSLAACLVFSTGGQAGLWMAHHVPLLGDFRVPARSVLPVMAIWSTVAVGLVLRIATPALQRRGVIYLAAAAGAAMIARFLPAWTAEVMVWLCVAGVIVALAMRRPAFAAPPCLALAVLSVVAFGSVVAFTPNAQNNLAQNRKLGSLIRRLAPPLASPFERADTNILQMGLYTAAVGRISAINGYGFPNRHFSMLYQALEGKPFTPTDTLFNLDAGQAGFAPLQQLYNVRFAISLAGGHPVVRRLADTPGAVWSSSRRAGEPDMQTMARVLRRRLAAPGWPATQLVTGAGNETYGESCRGLRFAAPKTSLHGRKVEIGLAVATGAPCPVTVSMTYAGGLHVFAVAGDRETRVTTYPAYGSLLGFTIPAGTRAVVITSALALETAASLFALAGGAIALLLLFGRRAIASPSE